MYNNAPYAYDASFSVLHDRELTGQVYGYDPDGDAITAHLVSGPSHGTLTFHADGSFSYTPNMHYVGPDSFAYTWSDGLGESEVAIVEVGVYNSAPVALGELFMLEPGQTFAVFLGNSIPDGYEGPATTVATLLQNDWDPDDDALELVLGSSPSSLWQFDELLNAWVFIPPAEFEGTDVSFQYFVTDGIYQYPGYSNSYYEAYPYAASWTVALSLQVGEAGEASGGHDQSGDAPGTEANNDQAPVKLNLERTVSGGAANIRIVNRGQPAPENDNSQGKINFVSFDVRYSEPGIAYIVFDVNDTCCAPCQCEPPCGCGVWEFWIELHVFNLTGRVVNEFSLDLGFGGIGSNFVRSAAEDGLDFDWPDKDTNGKPTDANQVLVQYLEVGDGRFDNTTVVLGTERWEEDTVLWSGRPHGRIFDAGKQATYFVCVDIPNYDMEKMPRDARTEKGYKFTLRLNLQWNAGGGG